jgi:hypothetical protein
MFAIRQTVNVGSGSHFQTKSAAAELRLYWSHPPAGADVSYPAFVLNKAPESPACFQGHRRVTGSRSPPRRSAKVCASSGLEKQKHHEVAIIAAQRVCERRLRYASPITGTSKAGAAHGYEPRSTTIASRPTTDSEANGPDRLGDSPRFFSFASALQRICGWAGQAPGQA